MRERDAARAALTAAQAMLATRATSTAAPGEDAEMSSAAAAAAGNTASSAAAAPAGLTQEQVARIQDKHKDLSRARKKRAVDADIISAEALRGLNLRSTFTPHAASAPGITTLAVCPAAAQSHRVVTGGADRSILVFDTAASRVAARIPSAHGKRVTSTLWHAGGSDALLSAGADGVLKLWRSADGETYTAATSLHAHAASIVTALQHPVADFVITVAADAAWALNDVAAGRVVAVASSAADVPAFHAGAMHPDGLLLATGGSDGRVRLYDIREQTCAAVIGDASPAPGAITALSLSENGYYMAAGGGDGAPVVVWDLRKQAIVHTLAPTPTAAVHISALAFDASGLYIAAGASDGCVRVWGSKEWNVMADFAPGSGGDNITALAWGAHAHTLYTASMDRSLRVYAA